MSVDVGSVGPFGVGANNTGLSADNYDKIHNLLVVDEKFEPSFFFKIR